MIPMQRAPPTVTKPAAGVMATRPTTAPTQAPMAVDFEPRTWSTKIHVSMAEAAAVLVVRKACTARGFAERAEPALKPNQPNLRQTGGPRRESDGADGGVHAAPGHSLTTHQRRAVPSMTKGIEAGVTFWGAWWRLPSIHEAIRAE